MVRINGFDLGAALAALKFFNLGDEEPVYSSNEILCNGLRLEGFTVLNPKQVTETSNPEDTVIQLSGGNRLLKTHNTLQGTTHVYYYNTPDNVQVYIDMDGVVADFEGFFIDMFGEERFKSMTPAELFGLHINGMIAGEEEQVFSKFKPLARAKELYEFLKPYNPIFLSSTGYSNSTRIEAQKLCWLWEQFGEKDESVFDFMDKAIFVNMSKKKAYYAAPNAILIDDRAHSIMPWTEAGGKGILHTSVDKTMEEFTKLYAEVKVQIKYKNKLKL